MTVHYEDTSIRAVNAGLSVSRATAALPQSTAAAIFTITGRVRIVSLVGEVTTAIQNQLNNTKLVWNPTGTGASTDMCAVLDIANDAVGTLYSLTGTFTDALADSLWLLGANEQLAYPGLMVQAGTVDLNCSASNTGSVAWQLIYVPITVGSAVVAA